MNLDNEKRNFFLKLLTGMAVVFGLYERIKYIFYTELIGDESLSISISLFTPVQDLIFQNQGYWDYVHPSGYYVLLKLWLTFLPHTDWSVRLMTLLFFIGSLFLVYYLARKISSMNMALIVLTFFSLHPLLFELSYQARMYFPAIFIFLSGTVILLLKKPVARSIGLCILGLSFYIDYLVFWGYAFLLFHLIFELKFDIKRLIRHCLTVFIIVFPQLVVLFNNVIFSNGTVRALSVDPNVSLHFVYKQLTEIFGLFDTASLLSGGLLVLFSGVLLFKKNNKSFVAVLIIFFSAVVLSYRVPVLLARHLVLLSVIIIFFISDFLLQLQQRNFILSLAFYISICVYYSFIIFTGKNMDYQSGLTNISQHIAHTNTSVFFLPATFEYVLTTYYFPESGVSKNNWSVIEARSHIPEIIEDQLYLVIYSTWCSDFEECIQSKRALHSECTLRSAKCTFRELRYGWQ